MRNFDAYLSDPHFGHKNILKLASRPFVSIEEHDEELVRRYNATVSGKEHVLWLGDCFWFSDIGRAQELLERLNGKKYLVLGNHDGSPHHMAQCGFQFVAEKLFLSIAGKSVIACHYPTAEGLSRPWDVKYEKLAPRVMPGGYAMHGHTHIRERMVDNRIHVGVDAWDYSPARHEEIEELLR